MCNFLFTRIILCKLFTSSFCDFIFYQFVCLWWFYYFSCSKSLGLLYLNLFLNWHFNWKLCNLFLNLWSEFRRRCIQFRSELNHMTMIRGSISTLYLYNFRWFCSNWSLLVIFLLIVFISLRNLKSWRLNLSGCLRSFLFHNTNHLRWVISWHVWVFISWFPFTTK